MGRSRWSCVALVGLALAQPVRADDHDELMPPDLTYAESLAQQWRRDGAARGFPAVMNAICTRGASAKEAAERVLADWGPAAVTPLLEEITTRLSGEAMHERCSFAAGRSLRDMLCHAGRAGDAKAGAPPDPRPDP